MATKTKNSEKLEIDLSGEVGKSFALRGAVITYAVHLGLDASDILKEMKKGDYQHHLKVFNKHFGNILQVVGG